jgi:hypothetical protein
MREYVERMYMPAVFSEASNYHNFIKKENL